MKVGNLGNEKRGIKGDDFEQLFNAYYVSLCLYARKYLGDEQQAEDAVQEVFYQLLQKKGSHSHYKDVRSYLYQSVRNQCLNDIRHQKVIKKHQAGVIQFNSDDKHFFNDIVNAEVYRQLADALNQLPKQCRTVYKLSLEGLKSMEIAEDLGISVETVKTHRKRAKRFLKERLKNLFSLLLFGL
ncbi:MULTISPECIES: RNA polymerase sigma-70 factor [unclassified Carboxylicivirga]|uniref:RNA polymerase sigma-70 factor n=1 Tax=Carboxylicivirga TaxID=1628153 RepID=UPI003D334E6D